MPAHPSLAIPTSNDAATYISAVVSGRRPWPRRPGRHAVCDRCDRRAVETCLWPNHIGVLWLCTLHATLLSRSGEAIRNPAAGRSR